MNFYRSRESRYYLSVTGKTLWSWRNFSQEVWIIPRLLSFVILSHFVSISGRKMVKVNESKQDDLHGHWPQSSLPSDDGSFVVLGRSPPQELNTQFTSNMSQQPTVCPAPPPHNSYPGSLPHLESQVCVCRFLIFTPAFVLSFVSNMKFQKNCDIQSMSMIMFLISRPLICLVIRKVLDMQG